MKRALKYGISIASVSVVTALGALAVYGQATEDAAADAPRRFPLASPAGATRGAIEAAPTGAVNQGPFDPARWRRGTANDPIPGAKLWNPVKLKMNQGGIVTSVAVNFVRDGQTYCAMANAGYDFTWTEMQHSPLHTWENISQMWSTCPHARAVPGVRVSKVDEEEQNRALEAGALVLAVPTIDSTAEAREAVKWTYFPPLGSRSSGANLAGGANFYGNVPGGYRRTINDNLVLIVMIETLEGLRDADAITKMEGVTAVYAAAGDLGNFSGFRQGEPDFERLINIVSQATIRNRKTLCGPISFLGRPDFTCFYGTSEAGLIQRGAAAELGKLAHTQGKVEVGPWAGMFDKPPAGRGGGD